jgi:hypothetical protein
MIKALFSPPPGCAIPELGPVTVSNSSKQNRIESDFIHIIEEYDKFITKRFRPDYTYILSHMKDVRCF